jgi:ribosomal protein L11 methyltransferase
MGFGTGHHATTRLCLEALQAPDLTGRRVLDVGTGSGVLAIAAALLGAAHTLGIDSDPDAVRAANENLALNPDARGVELVVADIARGRFQPADVVTANLTGALLVRSAARLTELVAPGGTLIVSGLMTEERDAVRSAFSTFSVVWTSHEDEWAALAMKKS